MTAQQQAEPPAQPPRRLRALTAFALLPAAAFLGLLLTGMMWASSLPFGIVGALVVGTLLVGAFRHAKDDVQRIGGIGLAVGAALILAIAALTATILLDADSLRAPFGLDLRDRAIPLVLVPLVAWAASAVIAEKRLRQSDGATKRQRKSSGRSVATWFRKHRLLVGAAAFVYLSLVGLLYETTFFVHLGLPAFRYTDPNDFAFATLGHPLLTLSVALSAAFVLLLYYWLWAAVNAAYRRQMAQVATATGLPWIGLAFLRLGGRAQSVIRSLLLTSTIVLLLTLPLVAAVYTAALTYASIAEEQTGRLRLVRPAVHADGAKHITSTAKHMVFTLLRCEQDEPPTAIRRTASQMKYLGSQRPTRPPSPSPRPTARFGPRAPLRAPQARPTLVVPAST